MSIRAEEITEILKSQIKGYEKRVDVAETGVVLSVGRRPSRPVSSLSAPAPTWFS